jgi:catechol 2,3-dioxygenase-like lactoylglutathione lyase family enzyme
MELLLHHVSVLTADVEKTVDFYERMLGMQVSARVEGDGGLTVFLEDGPAQYGLGIEVIGPPFVGWMDERFEGGGPLRSHISFQVADVDDCYRELEAKDVDIVTAPRSWRMSKGFAIRHSSGVIAQIFQSIESGILVERQPRRSLGGEFSYSLHHVSVVTDELHSLEQFYQEILGLRTILDLKQEGIVFMADPASIEAKGRDTPSIEIIAPPGFWEREREFLDRCGPGIDHVSFLVPDVDSAYQELRAKGASFHVPPTDFEATRLAFFKDPDGLDIEIELPNLTRVFVL